jgi:hypothetical protein
MSVRYAAVVAIGGWQLGGPSPFLTERARTRAPQVLSYAAVPGAAMLVAASGAVVLYSGEVSENDASRIGKAVAALGGHHDGSSFRVGTTCVHGALVCQGWTLCVLSTSGVHPSLVIERLRRASKVLALALFDGVPPDSAGSAGSGGAPATAMWCPTRTPAHGASRTPLRALHSPPHVPQGPPAGPTAHAVARELRRFGAR